MKLLYYCAVNLYHSAIFMASFFNKKASLRVKGVKHTFKQLKSFKAERVVWVHCASLGEFEQGRPLIEALKKKNPSTQVVLSFFSPSGYEIRKNYEHADLVLYLPRDSRRNAKRLVTMMNPGAVFFVKYEFWYYYISEIARQHIPLYLVSGIFRPEQVFFKRYGDFYRKILKKFSRLYVQTASSMDLLKSIGIEHASLTGDTRFDRVYEISQNRRQLEIVEAFKGKRFVLVAGSTWPPDEDLLFAYMNESKPNIKYIIVPHEVTPAAIERVMFACPSRALKYSEANIENAAQADVLIIDNVGMLSSLYAYGEMAYIGGGFGKGIHNTLEAAVYGIPIVFGPKYQKFEEAKELILRSAAFTVSGIEEFTSIAKRLTDDEAFRQAAGAKALEYVNENLGATERILNNYEL